MCIRQKVKINNTFATYCFKFFSSERVLIEHKVTCLKINGKQTVKLRIYSI